MGLAQGLTSVWGSRGGKDTAQMHPRGPSPPRISRGRGGEWRHERQVQSLGWEDPLEESMATHSCILMHDTGCLGLVHWEDPEGRYGEGGGRRVQDGSVQLLSRVRLFATP